MNHIDIEEQHVIDLYLMGKLPAEEAARFEEHYLSCPECLDRLEQAESLQRGFKRAAGQDVARLAATRQLAGLAWLTRLGRSRQMAFVLLAVFAVAALPGGLALRKDRELKEVRQAQKKEQEEARLALQRERERSQATGAQTAEVERLRKKQEASSKELARAQETIAGMTEQLQQALRPQVNTAILALGVERSGGPDDEPTASYLLPKTLQSLVLELAIDPPWQPAYRVELRDPQGKVLWTGAGLRRKKNDTLSLILPSSMLAPGDYTLTAEGLAPGGKPVPAGRFIFRVEPAD